MSPELITACTSRTQHKHWDCKTLAAKYCRVHGGRCQITGIPRTAGGPGLAGRARGAGSQHWAGTGAGLGNALGKLLMLMLKGQDPNWTSMHQDQSPPTNPSVGDMQPVFPCLTQLYGVATWPSYAWLTPLHVAPKMPRPTVHSSSFSLSLPLSPR